MEETIAELRRQLEEERTHEKRRDTREKKREKREKRQSAVSGKRDKREKKQSGSRARQNSNCNLTHFFAFSVAAPNICLKQSESRRMRPSRHGMMQPTPVNPSRPTPVFILPFFPSQNTGRTRDETHHSSLTRTVPGWAEWRQKSR
jgi:hypothetical protein